MSGYNRGAALPGRKQEGVLSTHQRDGLAPYDSRALFYRKRQRENGEASEKIKRKRRENYRNLPEESRRNEILKKARNTRERESKKKKKEWRDLLERNKYVVREDDGCLARDGELLHLCDIFRGVCRKAFDAYRCRWGVADDEWYRVLTKEVPIVHKNGTKNRTMRIQNINIRKGDSGVMPPSPDFRPWIVLYRVGKEETENLICRKTLKRLSDKVSKNFVGVLGDDVVPPVITEIGIIGYGVRKQIKHKEYVNVSTNRKKVRGSMSINLEEIHETSLLVGYDKEEVSIYPGQLMMFHGDCVHAGPEHPLHALANCGHFRLNVEFDSHPEGQEDTIDVIKYARKGRRKAPEEHGNKKETTPHPNKTSLRPQEQQLVGKNMLLEEVVSRIDVKKAARRLLSTGMLLTDIIDDITSGGCDDVTSLDTLEAEAFRRNPSATLPREMAEKAWRDIESYGVNGDIQNVDMVKWARVRDSLNFPPAAIPPKRPSLKDISTDITSCLGREFIGSVGGTILTLTKEEVRLVASLPSKVPKSAYSGSFESVKYTKEFSAINGVCGLMRTKIKGVPNADNVAKGIDRKISSSTDYPGEDHYIVTSFLQTNTSAKNIMQQRPHIDWSIASLILMRKKWGHIPLNGVCPCGSEGSYIQVWTALDVEEARKRSGTTEVDTTVIGTIVYVPLGKILLLPPNVIHGGGFRVQKGEAHPRLHFYVYPPGEDPVLDLPKELVSLEKYIFQVSSEELNMLAEESPCITDVTKGRKVTCTTTQNATTAAGEEGPEQPSSRSVVILDDSPVKDKEKEERKNTKEIKKAATLSQKRIVDLVASPEKEKATPGVVITVGDSPEKATSDDNRVMLQYPLKCTLRHEEMKRLEKDIGWCLRESKEPLYDASNYQGSANYRGLACELKQSDYKGLEGTGQDTNGYLSGGLINFYMQW